MQSVKTYPISRERVDKVRGELRNSMSTYSLIRRVVRPVPLDRDPARAGKGPFNKIGVSSITDKIWFVDAEFESGYYTVGGIGTSYALNIAKTETVYLMNTISQATKNAEIEVHYRDHLSPDLVYQAAHLLQKLGHNPDLVLTNVKDHVDFWRYEEYGGFGRETYLKMPGHEPLLVDTAPEVPESISYVIDSRRFGTLVLKKDLEVSVKEIPQAESAAIQDQIPTLRGQDLSEKVRLVIEEILRIDVDQTNAIIPIRKV